jgi:ATP phosphoribosyltransferase
VLVIFIFLRGWRPTLVAAVALPLSVIPTYGATEALIPEDADLIIENTETGTTLAKNRLKIVGELFVSSGCLIGRKGILEEKGGAVGALVDRLMEVPGVSACRAGGNGTEG